MTGNVVFFTVVDNAHYEGCRTEEMIKSFKLFHPDIELKVFRDFAIDMLFSLNEALNFNNSKAAFALEVYRRYNLPDNALVVYVDSAYIFFDRCHEILDAYYDVAFPTNFNALLNAAFDVGYISVSDGDKRQSTIVPYNRMPSGGIVASPNKAFWQHLEFACLRCANWFRNYEDDVLGFVVNTYPYNVRVLDGDFEYTSPAFKCYYGVSSQYREKGAQIIDGKVMLDDKPMVAYHFAKGVLPKEHWRDLFSTEVADHIQNVILK